MSKPSKKDLLKYFDAMCLFLANHHWTERDERAVAIRELIKNQPLSVVKAYAGYWTRKAKRALKLKNADFNSVSVDYSSRGVIYIYFYNPGICVASISFWADGRRLGG